MMLYRNTKVKFRSPDGDTDYFDIVAGVLQGDTLAQYLFIICLDYALRTFIDKIKENGFKLTKERSRRYYITKTIKIRRTRHARHCWRSRDELISDLLLWTPSHGQAKGGRPDRTYIQQLYKDTGCSLEDQPEAMDDWEAWRERARDIRADGATRWWWWKLFYGIQEIHCVLDPNGFND